MKPIIKPNDRPLLVTLRLQDEAAQLKFEMEKLKAELAAEKAKVEKCVAYIKNTRGKV